LSFVVTTAKALDTEITESSPYRVYHRYVEDDVQELQQFRTATS
jgi:hypothetical protein